MAKWSRRLVSVSIGFVLILMDGSASFGEEPALVGPIKQAIARAAATSTAPLEFAFFKQIEGNNVDGNEECRESLVRWLSGDIRSNNEQEVRLLTCVYVFFGTGDSLEQIAVQSEQLTPDDHALIVLLRMPGLDGVPSARVAAVVEVREAQDRSLYSVSKTFEHRINRWVMLSSHVERKSP